MSTWMDFTAAAPVLAARARARFEAHRHHVLATVRADGSPRVSGSEVTFLLDDLWVGSMAGARKAKDLLRDPRMALHSAPLDLDMPESGADAKVGGRAVPVSDPAALEALRGTIPEEAPVESHWFRVQIVEVTTVWVAGDHLEIEWWTETGGLRRIERR